MLMNTGCNYQYVKTRSDVKNKNEFKLIPTQIQNQDRAKDMRFNCKITLFLFLLIIKHLERHFTRTFNTSWMEYHQIDALPR